MTFEDAINTMMQQGPEQYLVRPKEWKGTGSAFSMQADSDDIAHIVPGMGTQNGMDYRLMEQETDWCVIDRATLADEEADLQDDSAEGLPRNVVENAAYVLGEGSAPALALADADDMQARGVTPIIMRRGNALMVGPAM